MNIRTNFKFLINVKNGDQQATRDQSRAPLTETQARSALSAQCLKVSRFPSSSRSRSHSARALYIKKNSVKNLYFLLLLFLKAITVVYRYYNFLIPTLKKVKSSTS